jgi:delta(3,5)-delta(2,4)-dienoyl-CoA isomerase
VAMAADIGTLQRLPRLTGNDSLARELALTGRFFDATTADRLGLVSRVVAGGKSEVREEAMRVAREIAALSPVATLGTKHLRACGRCQRRPSLEGTC